MTNLPTGDNHTGSHVPPPAAPPAPAQPTEAYPTGAHAAPVAPQGYAQSGQVPPGYAPPGYAQPATVTPETGPKKLNVLALISAIIGAIGFICACIPGAFIIGWVLLPIAFVLSIISLFLTGDKKWLGFVGLGFSIVGTIVGIIVFVLTMVGLANTTAQQISGGDTNVTLPGEDGADEEAIEPEAGEDGPGSRANPLPLDATISNDNWTVQVNSYNADGNAAVAEGNDFNEPAPEGSHYEIVNATITFTGDDKATPLEAQFAVVTEAGNVIGAFDTLAVLADAMPYDEVYSGASVTGSYAFLVPDDENVLLRVTPGILAEEFFLQP